MARALVIVMLRREIEMTPASSTNQDSKYAALSVLTLDFYPEQHGYYAYWLFTKIG